MTGNSGYGVYIAYVDDGEDTAWVRYLAARLRGVGLEPFPDEWEIRADGVVVHELEKGIARSAWVVTVFGPAWADEPRVREQYGTLMRPAVEAGRGFVSVLRRTAATPVFAADHRMVDFSGADGTESPEWERCFAELVTALRDLAPAGDPRDVLDRALAEAATPVVDDVRLSELVDGLDELALRVLVGASVFRVPVEAAGVAWTVSRFVEREPDGTRADPAAPLETPAGWREAMGALTRAGLLTPSPSSDAREGDVGGVGGRWAVHRRTASALAAGLGGRIPEILLVAAHAAAADFWSWRVQARRRGREETVADLLEARFHMHAAGWLEEALSVTDTVCRRLHTWGEWGREEQLYREVLGWLPDPSGREAAVTYHQLGIIAQLQGEYERALEYYQRSLAIKGELGDRAGAGRSYGQLGIIAQTRGEYGQALEYYRQALAVFEELGDRSGVGSSYHQLGSIAQLQGEYGRASEYYEQALAVFEESGDRSGVGGSYQLLGSIAQERGEYGQALDCYEQAFNIFEELGDQAGSAASLSRTGAVYTETGQAAAAVSCNLQALGIRLRLRIPQAGVDLRLLRRQRAELGDQAFKDVLAEELDPRSITDLLRMLDE